MEVKPKLVFITSRFPYPLEKGDKLRAFHFIKELSLNFNIHLISLSDQRISEANKKVLAPYVVGLHVFHLPWFRRIYRLAMGLFSSKPYQIAYFTDYWIQKKIDKLLVEIEPNHIFCQLIRSAEYVKNYHHCHKTLDYMDALSKGMDRRIPKTNFFIRGLIRTESQRLRVYERKIFNYFEFHTMISEQDTFYISHPDHSKIKIVPNGIDCEYFKPQPNIIKDFDLVFVGNLSYAPNVDALQWFEKNVLSKKNNLTMLIAGANPSRAVKSLEANSLNITLVGWQDDIRSSYARGCIFIAPMQIGTGLQNKLLEAMAMEIPCITTSIANDALLALPNEQIIVINTAEEMITQIEVLLKDKLRSQKIGMEGRKFVAANYNWKKSAQLLTSYFIGPN